MLTSQQIRTNLKKLTASPTGSEDISVLQMPRLSKDLDKLRAGWKVYFEWNAAKACILIRATSLTSSKDIIEAMEGIK
jgi:hypothetical protein